MSQIFENVNVDVQRSVNRSVREVYRIIEENSHLSHEDLSKMILGLTDYDIEKKKKNICKKSNSMKEYKSIVYDAVQDGVRFMHLGNRGYLPKTDDYPYGHTGILTVAWKRFFGESDMGHIEAGFSFCSPSDPFVKVYGNWLAFDRLDEMNREDDKGCGVMSIDNSANSINELINHGIETMLTSSEWFNEHCPLWLNLEEFMKHERSKYRMMRNMRRSLTTKVKK